MSLGINNTFNQYDDLNASPLRNLEFIITSGDELLEDHPSQVNVLINELKWAIPQAQTTLNQMKNLLAQFPLPSYCLKISTDCTFHDNGRILNYTTTGDPFVVNQGTQWEREIPGLTTIIIHDEKGNFESKEHRYGSARESVTHYYEGTSLQKNYTRYYTDGTNQTHTAWYNNPENTINKHYDWGSGGGKVYSFEDSDSQNPGTTTLEIYYWDDGNIKSSVTKDYGRQPHILCITVVGDSDPCAPEYFVKDWAN